MITLIGEALINLVRVSGGNTLRALPGGNALATAVRAARLGYPTTLMARLSGDEFGQILRSYAARNGVDVSAAPDADEPTMIAVSGRRRGLGLGPPGSLYFHGTASWEWSSEELRGIPAATSVLYVGSLAGGASPSSARILRATAKQRSRGATVCADLDALPEVVGSPGRGRVMIDRLIRSADVVRASIGSIAWLHPGRAPEAVAEQWLAMGPKLVVITCGADGVIAVHGTGAVVHRPAHPGRAPRAASPPGADDAFTAGLLGGLHQLDQGGDEAGLLSGDLGSLSVSDLGVLVDTAVGAEGAGPVIGRPTAPCGPASH
jgi:fructokinase